MTDSTRDQIAGEFETVDNALNAIGWATQMGNEEPLVVEVAVDGKIVSEATCHQMRPDITVEGSHLHCGFKIPIPPAAIRRLRSTVHAIGNGTPISGGPIIIDFSKVMAIRLESISNQELVGSVSGWPGASIQAKVKVDGNSRGSVIIRKSEQVPGKKPQSSFRWRLPEDLCDGAPHVYVVEIDHEDAVVRSDCLVARYPNFFAFIDAADFNHVRGWAYREDRNTPIVLHAVSNGRTVGKAVANESRVDVRENLSTPTARLGFTIILDEMSPVDHAIIELVDAETGLTVICVSIANGYETLASVANHEKRSAAGGSPHVSPTLARRVLGASASVSVSTRNLMFAKKVGRTVSIVIPVYGGAQELAECMDSLLKAKNGTEAEFLLINDASPDPVIRRYLRDLERQSLPQVKIFHRTSNHGFSASVNVGMVAAGGNDVVLLNADTVVQDHWLDKIVAAAEQDPTIGTVTPFSSNGEICTLPYLCKSIPVEDPLLAKQVDAIASHVNKGRLVDLPVAIGFCMYIRRDCLSEVGLFDAEKWGRGYGEEVDFCLKASSFGWRHVLATDTFLVHRGAVSFGDEKLERIMESAKKINETFPFYDAVIQRFIARDPVASARRDVNLALLGSRLAEKRVLHVTHALGGGTETYIGDISDLYRAEGYANIILRFGSTGSASIEVNGDVSSFRGFFQSPHTERYGSDEIDTLRHHLEMLNISHVHLHGPIGVPPDLFQWLTDNYAFDITIHDYAWVCPSPTLTTPSGVFFGESPNDPASLNQVFASPYPGLERFASDAGGDVESYRNVFRPAFSRARLILAGSSDAAERMKSFEFIGNYRAVEHPRSATVAAISRTTAPFQPHEPVRVAMIGGISDVKGFPTLVSCASLADRMGLPIQFIVMGFTRSDDLVAKFPNVEVLGKYEPADIGSLLARHQPHVCLFPNAWPETFSYTLSIALQAGVWPIVTDIGAPAERVRTSGFGTVIPRRASAEEICEHILLAAQRPERLTPPTVAAPASLNEYLLLNG